jgi:endonuclease/exonuclease/phosphatase family metal-dependent hydrolase
MNDEQALFPAILTLFLLAMLVGAAWGCTGQVGLLGLEAPHPLDEVGLMDDPRLSHLGNALDDGMNLRAGDLFSGFNLLDRPDPSQLLRAFSEENPTASPLSISLRVRSFNVGLLDISLFGSGLQILEAPALRARREILFRRVFEGDADLVLLQEVWADQDIERALAFGEDAGFSCQAFFEEGGKTGLVTCARESGLSKTPMEAEACEFHGPAADVLSYAGDVVRSLSWVDLEWIGVGKGRVYNVHLSPMFHGRYLRMYQMRAVGIHARGVSDERLVILGGDLNASAFYARDNWENGQAEIEHGWWDTALAYPLGLFYGGFSDLMIRGRNGADADLEVRNAIALSPEPKGALSEAYGEKRQCPSLKAAGFTATDCNSLHFRQYAGKEPPSRLDHLWAVDPQGRIHVQDAQMIFTEKIDLPGGERLELSDHCGVEVTLKIKPARQTIMDLHQHFAD